MRSDKNNLIHLGRVAALSVVGALICSAGVSSNSHAQVVSKQVTTARNHTTSGNAAAVRAFQERLKEYLKLRAQISKGVPKLTPKSTPAEIEAHQAAFGEGLRAARADAKPGDLFTPDVAQHVRHVVSTEVQGARLRDWRAKLQTAVKGVPLRVNYPYPETKELVEMPPTLLLVLPELPKELRYYFAGKALLLMDHEPRLIIDYLPDVLP